MLKLAQIFNRLFVKLSLKLDSNRAIFYRHTLPMNLLLNEYW